MGVSPALPWDGANPEGVPFTAGSHPVAPDRDHDWWVVSGSRGTRLHALMIPPRWRTWGIKRGIVFQDEGARGIRNAGNLGAGYGLLRMTNLREGGAYEIDSAMIVLSHGYHPGDEADALAMLHAPLETQTRPLPIDGGRYAGKFDHARASQ